MRIASWNVNGLRSATKKGFASWLTTSKHDVILLQEVRAAPDDLDPAIRSLPGYTSHWYPAQKKGYSGVGIYVSEQIPVSEIFFGMNDPHFDNEGRVIGIEIENTVILSSYFPNSQREGVRLGYKLEFCQALHAFLDRLLASGKQIVIGGDFNIAHEEIDLANPKQNVKNAGFLPEERAWMSHFVSAGYIDTFRVFEKRGGFYTWWKQWPGIRERNIGWRLDYHFISPGLRPKLKSASIHAEVLGSDHCPVSITLD